MRTFIVTVEPFWFVLLAHSLSKQYHCSWPLWS